MSIRRVKKFHQKFDLPDGSGNPMETTMSKDALEFRINFLQEELDEYKEAMEKGDQVAAFDALLDLEYIVHGTALFMNIDPITWDQGSAIVHRKNMQKMRVKSKTESGRGSTFDVVKPKGWTGPEEELEKILCRKS